MPVAESHSQPIRMARKQPRPTTARKDALVPRKTTRVTASCNTNTSSLAATTARKTTTNNNHPLPPPNYSPPKRSSSTTPAAPRKQPVSSQPRVSTRLRRRPAQRYDRFFHDHDLESLSSCASPSSASGGRDSFSETDSDAAEDDRIESAMGVIRKKTAQRGTEGGTKYHCDVCSVDVTSTVSLGNLYDGEGSRPREETDRVCRSGYRARTVHALSTTSASPVSRKGRAPRTMIPGRIRTK